MRHIAAVIVVLAALSPSSCARDASLAAADPSVQACLPGGAGAPVEYVRTDSWGHDSAGFERVGGVAVDDDRVFVYDAAHPRIVVLDTALAWQAYFGRSGDGPGELMSVHVPPRLGGGSWRWLDAYGDTVHVFDGRRLTWFDRTGRFLGSNSPSAAGAMGSLNARVLHTTGGILYGHGGYDLNTGSADKPVLSLRLHERRGDVYRMALAPWPRTDDGVPWGHPAQARPLWDAVQFCAWLSDGASGRVVVVNIETGAADTLEAELPGDDSDVTDASTEALRSSMGARGPLPDPTAVVRVVDLIVDPDRNVWLLLRGSVPDDVRVVRITGPGGATDELNPPAWPRAFGAGGSFYAIETDSLDVLSIARYIPRAASAAASALSAEDVSRRD